MLKRVDLTWNLQRGWHVNLPTYFMIACTHLPIEKGMVHRDGVYPDADPVDVLKLRPTVIVSMPEDECIGEDGQICRLKIAQKYAGNDLYDNADYAPPVLHDFQPIELNPPKEFTFFEKLQHRMGFG